MFAILTRPRIAAAAILIPFIILSLVFVVPLVSLASGRTQYAGLVIEMLPMPFYLWAIWTARRAVLLIGTGDALSSVMARMLRRIGIALFAGGVVRVFGVTFAFRLIEGTRSIGYWDPAAITIGVVGLTLVVVARLVVEAEAIRAELDEFL